MSESKTPGQIAFERFQSRKPQNRPRLNWMGCGPLERARWEARAVKLAREEKGEK